MTSYDEIPYDSRAHYSNHPDRMAVVATMFGLEAQASLAIIMFTGLIATSSTFALLARRA